MTCPGCKPSRLEMLIDAARRGAQVRIQLDGLFDNPAAARSNRATADYLHALVTGFTFPNALLQHALPDLEKLTLDITALQRKRDHLVTALRNMGYQLHSPEATFYLLVHFPLADDQLFIEALAEHNILCLPGTIVEMPGYFRLSLTANEEMIERALPGFQAALYSVNGRKIGIGGI